MFNFKTLQCYNCRSVILNLPELEISKLDGLTFQCECCGHQNLLAEFKFYKVSTDDPHLNILSFESVV